MKDDPDFIEHHKTDLAASLEATVVDILMDKLRKAAKQYNIKEVAVAGGVSANNGLRNSFREHAEKYGWNIFIPKFSYTTDNAAMIAITGYFKYLDKEPEEEIGELLKAKNLSLSTAESCTGGGIAALITSVPGSSEYFNGGIVAYSNEIKKDLLHVSAETLAKYGAVSRETVIEMVKGAMKTLKTDCAVATSGIAGPGGGTPEKPVGTVWIAAAYKNDIVTMKQEGDRGRAGNVQSAIQNALSMLCDKLK